MTAGRSHHQADGSFAWKMTRDRQSAAIQKIENAGIAKHCSVCLKIRRIIRQQVGNEWSNSRYSRQQPSIDIRKEALRFGHNSAASGHRFQILCLRDFFPSQNTYQNAGIVEFAVCGDQLTMPLVRFKSLNSSIGIAIWNFISAEK